MSDVIKVLKTRNINDGEIKTKEINSNTDFKEIISICNYNINYLLKESSKKAIWKFNHMRSEIRYWEGIKELTEQRKEALLALEQKEDDRKQGALEEFQLVKQMYYRLDTNRFMEFLNQEKLKFEEGVEK